ncbi:MarR family transcriptional regulator [Georgenia sp. TF02-10]|uniref:MarR family winged helix-turn-helix transcriptional regulator n=1 Tax=Georgenia sp. TF02-10 TaxID=2917725 RepID=UPI001FA786D7|nr:MarR family transcriptional regulator [Georgenia sp. TF02-10]UNX53826.1 MarR family transcriptional regulator [Georgenia sp. TF02-10]
MSGEERDERLSEAVCLALYSAMNATLQLYRDLLAPWGLTYQQLMVLAVLWEHEEATPGRIAETLMLDSSSVAGLLNRLERAGLVSREVDPDDRRRVRVRATPDSQEVRGQLGWLEDCLTQAMDLDPGAAHELVARLSGLRETVSTFPRPAAPSEPLPASPSRSTSTSKPVPASPSASRPAPSTAARPV